MADDDTRQSLAKALLTPREQEQVAAIATIRERGEDGASDLIAGLMLRNAHDATWALEQAYEGEKVSHEHTRQQRDDAWDRIAKIRRRVSWLMGETDDPEGWDVS